MISGISGILFDKDGTLFDFEVSWSAWARTFLNDLAQGDEARAAALGARIGYDWQAGLYRRDSLVIAGTDDDVVAALLPGLPGATPEALKRRISLAAAKAPLAEAVPLGPFLNSLKSRGIRIGVATNDSAYSARAQLEQAGVLGLFDFVAGADSGHGPKPEPGMCLAFAREMGLDPAEVLMVGDSQHDLHAGAAAGMRTLGVLTGLAEAEDLAPHADIVLPDIGALLAGIEDSPDSGAVDPAGNATQTESESVAI